MQTNNWMKRCGLVALCGMSLQLSGAALTPVAAPSWPITVSAYPASATAGGIQLDIDVVYDILGNGVPLGGFTAGGTAPIAEWNDHGQFAPTGHAFLFAPRDAAYEVDAYVGYYTSFLGIGESPTGTKIKNIAGFMGNGQLEDTICPGGTVLNNQTGSLNTFWRSVENFEVTTEGSFWFPASAAGMTWATSQASPMRKLVVKGPVWLFQLAGNYQGGFASGGFMADCEIDSSDGGINAGGQQQYFIRNTSLTGGAEWGVGIWNLVFIGCEGAPDSFCGNCGAFSGEGGTVQVLPGFQAKCDNTSGCEDNPQTCISTPIQNIPEEPKIIEKPYIVANTDLTEYHLWVPQVEENKVGPL